MRPGGSQLGRWFAGGVVIITLAVTALSLITLQNRLGEIRTAERSKPAWIVSRLEFEFLRFQNALAEHVIGEMPASEVVLRFDILWSRGDIVSSGTTADRLAQEGMDLGSLRDLKALLREHEPAIMAISAGDSSQARDVLADFSALSDELRAFTLKALEATSASSARDRADLLRMSNIVALLCVATVIAALVLLGIFWRDVRRERRVSEERLRLFRESQAASVAKGQFISVINHELRTPLTSINGSLSLLKGGAMGQLDPQVQRLVEIAHLNCDRLSSLINDLLDIDKLESGQISLDIKPVDLSALVAEAVETHANFAVARKVTISADPIAGDVEVMGDRGRLSQVLSNLISNAAKFSDSGGRVEVGLRSDNGQATFYVRDYGLGIPADQQKTVFERFKQVDSSDHRSRGGTGLGLSIAKAIVEAMGGRIDLDSAPGEGSLFSVTLARTVKHKDEAQGGRRIASAA